MATTIGSTPNTFVNIYSAQFTLGKTDFDTMSALFLETLSNPNISSQKKPENEKVYEYIAVEKEKLQTLVNAQNDYLNNTLLGRIKKTFQSILGYCFGTKSSLEQAQEGIDRLNKAGFNNPSASITSKSQAMLARSIAIRENTTISIALGDESNPSTILIAKPDGDVYEIPRDIGSCKGQGSQNPGSRRYYVGTLHRVDGTSQQIGSITNLTTLPLDQYDSNGIIDTASRQALSMGLEGQELEEHLAKAKKTLIENNNRTLNEVSKRMKKEFEFSNGIQNIDGPIRVYDNFSINISGTNASFTIVEHHPNGDLSKFLEKHQMNERQMIEFMLDSLRQYSQLHSENKIHRDVKPENILVSKGLKPVPTDFETGISLNDKARKRENASTVKYMSPEYVTALLNGVYLYVAHGNHKQPRPKIRYPVPPIAFERSASDTKTIIAILSQRDPDVDLTIYLEDATKPAMDVWGLGLVFFQLVYGVDLIGGALEFDCMPSTSELAKTQNMHNILRGKLPEFIAAMESKTEPTGDNEQWNTIWHQIKARPEIWEQIILPMLNADPKKRATMAGSLIALEQLKSALMRHPLRRFKRLIG